MAEPIINLCQEFKVTHNQASILQHGLSFALTDHSIHIHRQLRESIIRACSSLQWYFFNKNHGDHFRGSNTNSFTRHKTRTKHTDRALRPEPPSPPMHKIPVEILQIQEAMLKLSKFAGFHNDKRNSRPNHTQVQWSAILQLKKCMDQVIIKTADKGDGIVLLDRDNYTAEANRQLNKAIHYQQIPRMRTEESCQQITNIIREMYTAKLISRDVFQDLLPPSLPSTRNFYLLPKIHKPLEDWPNKYQPPGRTILTNINTESQGISQMIDSVLQPHVISMKSYIRDSIDFINRIRQTKIPKDALLVTMDVTSLYTNIPHQLIRDTVTRRLNLTPNPINSYLLRMLDNILEYNEFPFENKFYHQVCGVAMGASCSPTLANLAFEEIEDRVLQTHAKKPTCFMRYLDDIFMVWPYGESELQSLIQRFNSQYPTISVTHTWDANSAIFLDVELYKGQQWSETGILDTRVYCKPQNTLSLIHRRSAHLPHTFRGTVKSQCIRYARISSSRENYRKIANKLRISLSKRGYTGKHDISSIIKHTEYRYFDVEKHNWSTCDSLRCRLCQLWTNIPSHIIQSQHQQLTRPTNCNSTDAIYILWCKLCPQAFYIGQTYNLRSRINNHISNIRTRKITNVTKHFNQHLDPIGMKLIGLNVLETINAGSEQTSSNGHTDLQLRIKLENRWIKRLQTSSTGLNHKNEKPDIVVIKGNHCPALKILASKLTQLTYMVLGDPKPQIHQFLRHALCPRMIYAPSIRRKITNILVRSRLPRIVHKHHVMG